MLKEKGLNKFELTLMLDVLERIKPSGNIGNVVGRKSA